MQNLVNSLFSQLEVFLDENRLLFDEYLTKTCQEDLVTVPRRLASSMRYSLLAGGKRIRPLLCVATAHVCGVSPERILPLALAFEIVHTASLIHDDLPCMDNDSLRRGRPSNHIVFGETLALLAGDALLAWAFELPMEKLIANGFSPEKVLQAMTVFSTSVGPHGICAGQLLDTDPQSEEETRDFVWKIAHFKTASLIRAAIVATASLCGASEIERRCYYNYGTHLGLAFQIVDDILDVTGTKEELGKTPGKDAEQGKKTFVAAYGLEKSKNLAFTVSQRAQNALGPLKGDVWPLSAFPHYLYSRTH